MRILLVAVLAIALAGCFESDIEGNGVTTATDTSTEDCSDGKGTVRVSLNGSGKVTVTVSDAASKVIYTKNFDGTGQLNDDEDISGAAGDWTMTVKFAGNQYSPTGFSGQWSMGLSC